MRRVDPALRFAAAGVVAAAVLTGIGGLVAANHHSPVACGDAQGQPAAIVTCLAPVMTQVRTPLGFGSGVLLANGYVVTNAHVVNPFDHVSVTVGQVTTATDVPVVGLSALDDIAVVGPVAHADTGTRLADSDDVHEGEALFLVGFPVDFSDDPAPTITGGILSRVRDLPVFGLRYLETDATIAHGQSGGALVDRSGRVVAISGLESESFGLGLSSNDVHRAVDRILAGKGDKPDVFKTDPETKSGTVSVPSFGPSDLGGGIGTDVSAADLPVQLLGLGPAAHDRTLKFDLSTSTELRVAFDRLDNGQIDPKDFGIFGDSTSPPADNGEWTYDVPAGRAVAVILANDGDSDLTTKWTSNIPLAVLGPHKISSETISVGQTVDRRTDMFGQAGAFKVSLAEDEQIDIYAGALGANIDFTVSGPNGLHTPVEVTDSLAGVIGLDAHESFKATDKGVYTITVTSNDEPSVGYRLRVTKLST